MKYILIIMAVLLVGCEEHHDNLPPDYTIQTNGTRYRWVDENGSAAIYTDANLEDAIEHAWDFYEYVKWRGSNEWRNVVEVSRNRNNVYVNCTGIITGAVEVSK